MAINPSSLFAGKIEAATTPYPYGKARDVSAPSDGTGTPWRATLVNDLFGFQQALLKASNQAPSGTPDAVAASQYLQAVVEVAAGRARYYTGGGTANAQTLTKIGDMQYPVTLFTGLEVEYIPTATNTGAATVALGALAATTVLRATGVALSGGELTAGTVTRLRYDGAAWRVTSPVNFDHVDADASTAYTVVAADAEATRRMTAATAIGVTLPNSIPAGWSIGKSCAFIKGAAGNITFSTAGTLRTPGGAVLSTPEGVAVVTLVGVGVWSLAGDV